ncbi:5-methyltetrahydropteroyltriglutamate--homocysteine methyltransferase [Atopobacter sp. AH10]|nr:5-methyltetrahydropteroyltriglutamate--homocysteine methyltransferase [Atopobacter sp. AH10]
MAKTYQAFTTSLMGSMPRSQDLLKAKAKAMDQTEESKTAYQALLAKETEEIVRFQEECGIDVVVNGELDRDNYMSFVAEKVPGIQLMSLEEISASLEDREQFEKSRANMDALDDTLSSPVIVDKIALDAELDYKEMQQLKKMTDHPIKATIPSPYLLTRSMWMDEMAGKFYDSRKELGKDIQEMVLNETKRLIDLGVDIIQLDEPILSDVVFNCAEAGSSFY